MSTRHSSVSFRTSGSFLDSTAGEVGWTLRLAPWIRNFVLWLFTVHLTSRHIGYHIDLWVPPLLFWSVCGFVGHGSSEFAQYRTKEVCFQSPNRASLMLVNWVWRDKHFFSLGELLRWWSFMTWTKLVFFLCRQGPLYGAPVLTVILWIVQEWHHPIFLTLVFPQEKTYNSAMEYFCMLSMDLREEIVLRCYLPPLQVLWLFRFLNCGMVMTLSS